MLNLEEIHERLTRQFGEAVLPLQPATAGDSFVRVAAERFHEVAAFLRDDAALAFDFLRCITGLETTEKLRATGLYGGDFVSIYHLHSTRHNHALVVHVELSRENPRVASVADLWPAADWHERETFDLVGIVYDGHPDLRRILLPDDWEGHPLRKDYVAPKEYHGLTNE